jgi:hypothetical protein
VATSPCYRYVCPISRRSLLPPAVLQLRLNRSAQEIAAMRAIKTGLDPAGLLNPGVLFT